MLPPGAVVLVTGATGFLGGHCLSRLAQEPCRLHAVNRHWRGPTPDGVTWHAADLCEPGQAAQLIGHVRPTHLLHAAWIATPGRFWTAPENIDWLQADLALLRAFGEAGGRRFVGVGTCAEYDWHQARFVEDESPIRPATLYGKAKAAMGAAAEAYGARYGFEVGWGRVFLPYGPGDASQRLIPMVIAALREGRPVDLTDGAQERDFVYAPDVAELFVRLLGASTEGVFNVGTGQGTRIRSVVERIADRIGRRELLRFGAIVPKTPEPPSLVADMAKAERWLGWLPPSRLNDVLENLIDTGLRPAGSSSGN